MKLADDSSDFDPHRTAAECGSQKMFVQKLLFGLSKPIDQAAGVCFSMFPFGHIDTRSTKFTPGKHWGRYKPRPNRRWKEEKCSRKFDERIAFNKCL